jgi:hypothetical protein
VTKLVDAPGDEARNVGGVEDAGGGVRFEGSRFKVGMRWLDGLGDYREAARDLMAGGEFQADT